MVQQSMHAEGQVKVWLSWTQLHDLACSPAGLLHGRPLRSVDLHVLTQLPWRARACIDPQCPNHARLSTWQVLVQPA